MKSKRYLLTHWLPMSSILFNIARICNSQFKCKYLKKEKLFLNFLFYFWNLHQILNIFKKNMMVIGNIFPNLRTVKMLVGHSLKSTVSEKLRQSTCESVPNICEISMRALLSFFSSFWGKLI